MKSLLENKEAVSPVIGTILMVAVTVVMAAIIGGFVYQMGKPKTVPNIATSLLDDVREDLDDGTLDTGRVARLVFESGDVIDESEVQVLATYLDGGVEYTAVKDGSDVTANFGDAMASNRVILMWVDSDGSGNLTPGDRLDFIEGGITVGGQEVSSATDFTVKIMHKQTSAVIASHTVKVY